MSREPYRWSKCSKQTYSLQTSLRVCGLGPPLSLVASTFLLPLNAAVADAENNRAWTKQDYKDKLFDPLVEKLLNELNDRFSDESNSILTSMSSLFPSSDNFLDRDALVPFADFYGLTGSIGAEIQVFKTQLQEQGVAMKCENGSPWGLRDVLQFLMPYREAYRQLYKAYTIAATLPVTSATNERSFSCLNLIKTYLRSTMEDGSLSLNREMAAALNMEAFVDMFKAKARRMEL